MGGSSGKWIYPVKLSIVVHLFLTEMILIDHCLSMSLLQHPHADMQEGQANFFWTIFFSSSKLLQEIVGKSVKEIPLIEMIFQKWLWHLTRYAYLVFYW